MIKDSSEVKASSKIYILGGAGFLGVRLAKRLERSAIEFEVCDLHSHDRSSAVTQVNVEDLGSLGKLGPGACIINLAAMHRDDVRPISRYDDVNVKGAENVCEFARDRGIQKIIFTSSVAVYGFAPSSTDETGEINYFNHYGRTKYEAEKVYKEWQAEDSENRTLVIVRPTVIFGEGNRGNVYNLLRQIASRQFIMFGNGENVKSMAYVENVAAFIQHCLSFQSGLHVYNYIDNPDFDMNTLVSNARRTLFGRGGVGLRMPAFLGLAIGGCADVIAKATGRNLPVSYVRMKKFLGTTQFASSAASTGFVPPVPLEDALERTLRYEFLEDNTEKPVFETE